MTYQPKKFEWAKPSAEYDKKKDRYLANRKNEIEGAREARMAQRAADLERQREKEREARAKARELEWATENRAAIAEATKKEHARLRSPSSKVKGLPGRNGTNHQHPPGRTKCPKCGV